MKNGCSYDITCVLFVFRCYYIIIDRCFVTHCEEADAKL